MPGLSKYVFTYEGEVHSLDTGKRVLTKLTRHTQRRTNSYRLVNDRGYKEYIEKAEIIQYGKHHRTLPETPRQFIERALFNINSVKKQQFGKVRHLGPKLRWKNNQ